MMLHIKTKHPYVTALLSAVLLCAILAGITLLFLYVSPYASLDDFLHHKISTRIFDADGNIIQIASLDDGLHREFVPLCDMPDQLSAVFMMSEDRHFYTHHGVDIAAVARAAAQNIKARRTVSGASTITMQLARMILPAKKRTVVAKAKEAFDSFRLEVRLSKERILELYLNNIPFGFNCEGAASAARTFFGTTPDCLTLPQIYCLAVIPRRPSLYNPITNPALCARAAYELYSETKEETCAKDERELSLSDFMDAAAKAMPFNYPRNMPHFVRYLSNAYGSMYVSPEIHTTVHLNVQRMAERLILRAVQSHAANRLTNGAVLVCTSDTGEIIAWAGSADFDNEKDNGQVDGVLAREQPGSSMKPFLYALALDRGYMPSSVLPDVPSEFGFEHLYAPQNFNNRYSGPIRLRVALASSLNVPAVYLLNNLGLNAYHEKLHELNFKSLEHSDPGLGLALGNGEVPLFELVQSFSVFARDGIFISLCALKGEKSEEGRRVYSSDSSRLICDILSDASSRATGFGYSRTFSTPFPAIFKTGTANQYQNITALGSTPLYTAGVWMGNFSGETVIGKTGSSIPAGIVRSILVSLQGDRAPDFKKPLQYKKERICQLSGLAASPFCPDTLEDYAPEGRKMQRCTWHNESGTSYPAEYAAWFRLKARNGVLDEAASRLEILSPRQNSVFIFDTSETALNQNIVVEAAGGKADVATVIIDGDKSSAFLLKRPFTCAVPLSPGQHEVSFLCGTEEAHVSYTVK